MIKGILAIVAACLLLTGCNGGTSEVTQSTGSGVRVSAADGGSYHVNDVDVPDVPSRLNPVSAVTLIESSSDNVTITFPYEGDGKGLAVWNGNDENWKSYAPESVDTSNRTVTVVAHKPQDYWVVGRR